MSVKSSVENLLHHLKSPKIDVIIKHYQSAEMDLSSIAVAYYLMLTVFPLILIAANIFPYLNIDISDLLVFLKNNLPQNIYPSASKIVVSTFSKPSGGLLGVATLTAFWTMSKSLTSLQKAINKAYASSKNRGFILSHLVGLAIGLFILFIVTFVLVFSTFSQTILEVLRVHFNVNSQLMNQVLSFAQPITFLVVLLALMILYYLLPDIKIVKMRCVLPGSLFTTVTLVYLSNLISKYMFHSFSKMIDVKLLSSIVIFVFMIWFIFLARILILGAILNASFQEIYYGQLEARQDSLKNLFSKLKK